MKRLSFNYLLMGSLAALLLTSSGCSTFRKMFSRPTHSKRQSADRPRYKEDFRQHPDPVADMFAFERRDRDYMKNKDLSDRERQLMQDSMEDDLMARDYARKTHSKYQENRLKTKEHVFGPNPFRK